MIVHNEQDILNLVVEDEWMMGILKTAKTLNLPDWWVCAGFVRSKIWDALHEYKVRTPLSDVDVIYYDPTNIEESNEKLLEAQLRGRMPDVPWSIKNEARMHKLNDFPPFYSSVDAISKFPETATALGLKLNDSGSVIVTAPHGTEDVIKGIIRPTPYFAEDQERMSIYKRRLQLKNWTSVWPKIQIAP